MDLSQRLDFQHHPAVKVLGYDTAPNTPRWVDLIVSIHHLFFNSKYQRLCQVNFTRLPRPNTSIQFRLIVTWKEEVSPKKQLSDDAQVVTISGNGGGAQDTIFDLPKIQKASFIKIINGFLTRLHWCFSPRRCKCSERGFFASASYGVWQDFACSWGVVNEGYQESGVATHAWLFPKSVVVSPFTGYMNIQCIGILYTHVWYSFFFFGEIFIHPVACED